MDWIEVIGIIAGTCSTIAFLPQALLIFKTKSVQDVSLPTYLLLFSGIGLWLIYGLFRGAPSIIVSNGIMLTLVSAIILLKLKYSDS